MNDCQTVADACGSLGASVPLVLLALIVVAAVIWSHVR